MRVSDLGPKLGEALDFGFISLGSPLRTLKTNYVFSEMRTFIQVHDPNFDCGTVLSGFGFSPFCEIIDIVKQFISMDEFDKSSTPKLPNC